MLEFIAYVQVLSCFQKWFSAKHFEDVFAIPLMSLGFVYLKKSQDGYVYSIAEPFIRDALLGLPIMKQMTCKFATDTTQNLQANQVVNAQMLGYLFEYFMQPFRVRVNCKTHNDANSFEQLQTVVRAVQNGENIPSWVKQVDSRWYEAGGHKLTSLVDADTCLQRALLQMDGKLDDAMKLLETNPLWAEFLKLRSWQQPATRTIVRHIASISSPALRIAMMFLLLQPTNILFYPPFGLGPDAIGFACK